MTDEERQAVIRECIKAVNSHLYPDDTRLTESGKDHQRLVRRISDSLAALSAAVSRPDERQERSAVHKWHAFRCWLDVVDPLNKGITKADVIAKVDALNAPSPFDRPAASRPDERTRAWQPIASAPKDGTKILVGAAHRTGQWLPEVVMWLDDPSDGDARWWPWSFPEQQPTHWMPLPAAPIAAASTPPQQSQTPTNEGTGLEGHPGKPGAERVAGLPPGALPATSSVSASETPSASTPKEPPQLEGKYGPHGHMQGEDHQWRK